MPVFYRGRRALVTDRVFETVQIGRLRYSISGLTDVHIVHCSGPRPGGRLLGLSALIAALLVVPVVGPASEIVTGVAAAVFLIGAAMALRRRTPGRWQLAAVYEGRPATLFESDDQTEFDQVCRGLRRALERSADNP